MHRLQIATAAMALAAGAGLGISAHAQSTGPLLPLPLDAFNHREANQT